METWTMRRMVMLTVLLCAGCISDQAFEEELKRSNMVTFEDASIPIPPSATFTWAPQITKYYADPRFEDQPVQGMFHAAIRTKLQEKGYRYTPYPDRSDLLVGYVLALESALDDDAIRRIYGVNPGFTPESPNPKKYEKGTVIIDVYDAGTRRSVWRTVLQGFAAFDLDEEERRARVEGTVNMMLQGFQGGS